MNFWMKIGQSDQWIAIPAQGGHFPPGMYTILAQSPQPHFNITVDITHYHPDDLPAIVRSKRSRRSSNQHQRYIRTNDEGVGILLPAKELAPGLWEIQCQDADLIAELFGEYKTVILRFEISPDAPPLTDQTDTNESAANSPNSYTAPELPVSVEAIHSDSTQQLPDVNSQSSDQPEDQQYEVHSLPELTDEQGIDRWVESAEPLVLQQTHLEGVPNEVLILAGQLGAPGDLEIRVYAQGRLYFESQQAVAIPIDAHSVAFQLPLPLPTHPWSGHLLGSLIFKPATDTQSTSLTFTVRCRLNPDVANPLLEGSEIEQLTDALEPGPENSGLAPHFETTVTEGTKILSETMDPLSQLDLNQSKVHLKAVPTEGILNETEDQAQSLAEFELDYEWPEFDDPFYDLTLDTLDLDLASNYPDLDPDLTAEANLTFSHPETQLSSDEELERSTPLVHLSTGPLVSLMTLGSMFRAAQDEVIDTLLTSDSTHTTKKLMQICQPLDTKTETHLLRSSTIQPDLFHSSFPRSHSFEDHLVSTFAPLPSPRVKVATSLYAGQPFDVTVLVQRVSFDQIYWVKLWVKESQAQSILDGPRWLVEPDTSESDIWQATTRLIAPVGLASLILEAWTVTPDSTQSSLPTVITCTIHEAETYHL